MGTRARTQPAPRARRPGSCASASATQTQRACVQKRLGIAKAGKGGTIQRTQEANISSALLASFATVPGLWVVRRKTADLSVASAIARARRDVQRIGGKRARDRLLHLPTDPFLPLRSGTTMASNILNNLAKGAIGIGAGVSLFQSSIYNVDGGFRAVMFDRLRGVQVCSPTPRRLPEAPSEAADRPHAHACMTTLDA